MKRIIALVLCFACLFAVCSSAMAATTTITDNGETYTVTYTITLNGTTSTGSVSAKTTSNKNAKLGVRAVIWFTGEDGTGTDSAEQIKSGTTSVRANISVPGGNYAYKGTSGHTFTKSNGSVWSKGLSKGF